MRPLQMPYTFEDRTGHVVGSDYDDIYDRMFIRVVPHPHTPTRNKNVLAIYSMGRRSTRHGDTRHLERQPSVILEFAEGAAGGLGNINFFYPPAPSMTIPMSRYLRKTAFFGGSLSRKFRASDGRDYRWEHRNADGHEWSCISEENYLVAHYDLRQPHMPAYGVSGNTLTVHESFCHLSIDIMASLLIMRYIEEHNL